MFVRVLTVKDGFYALWKKNPPDLVVTAIGSVPTSGWTNPNLTPWVYVSMPTDGIQDLDFTAAKPTGIVNEVITEITADVQFKNIDIDNHWGPGKPLKGFRIHATDNKLVVELGTESVLRMARVL